MTRRLAEIGEKPEDLDAVLVTHEHSDHISGLPRLVRWREKKKKPIPVFISKLTSPLIDWDTDGQPPPVEQFQAGSGWTIGNIVIQSFTIPHDAVDPVGFCFHAEGVKVGIATDLGYMPESIKVHLRRVQMLLLESNHDLEMLKVGPYPWSVKQRVMSRVGHLSNEAAAEFLERNYDGQARYVILAHLSESNNLPALARVSAERALCDRMKTKEKILEALQK